MNEMWTEERFEAAKTLAAEGWSAAQIADRLGGLSRCAVIGKLHRNGLKGGGGQRCGTAKGRPRKPPHPKRRHYKLGFGARFQSPVPLKPMFVKDPPRQPTALMLDILDLKPVHCKFPIGDPKQSDFGFCGASRHQVSPYCEYHHRIAYRPVKKSRDKEAVSI